MPQSNPLFNEFKDFKYTLSAGNWAGVFALSTFNSRPATWDLAHGIKKKDFPHPSKVYGLEMEPLSKQKFRELYHEKYPTRRIIDTGNRALQEDPQFGASPDGIVLDEYDYIIEGLEMKNPWSKEIPAFLKDDHLQYILQSIMNMAVFKVDKWNLFFYRHEKKEYAWFIIYFNREAFLKLLAEAQRFVALPERPIKVPPNFTKKWKLFIFENFAIECKALNLAPPS